MNCAPGSEALRALSFERGGIQGARTAEYFDRTVAGFFKCHGCPVLGIGAALDLFMGARRERRTGVPLEGTVYHPDQRAKPA